MTELEDKILEKAEKEYGYSLSTRAKEIIRIAIAETMLIQRKK